MTLYKMIKKFQMTTIIPEEEDMMTIQMIADPKRNPKNKRKDSKRKIKERKSKKINPSLTKAILMFYNNNSLKEVD